MSTSLIRLGRVKEKVGLQTTAIYTGMGEGTFPLPVRIGSRSVAWVESEIDAWISQRAAAPRAIITTISPAKRRANRLKNSAHAAA